jgi:glutathione S-transferase
MLVLRASPSSPFVRKVKMAIDLVGLTAEVKIDPSDTMSADDSVRGQNPLGKIPTLLLEDGTALYDSRVIVEYLDERGGGKLIPAKGKERLLALRMQALGDGIMDAGVLQIYEKRFRPEEKWVGKWTDHQAGKVERAFASLEKDPPSLASGIHIGHLAIAAALGYFDFRFEGKWRAQHPKLVKWLDDFAAKVPSFKATTPAG